MRIATVFLVLTVLFSGCAIDPDTTPETRSSDTAKRISRSAECMADVPWWQVSRFVPSESDPRIAPQHFDLRPRRPGG